MTHFWCQTHQGGGSRINLHHHETDDIMPTVTVPEITAEHATAIIMTTTQGLSKKVRLEQRAFIQSFSMNPMIYKE